MKKLVYIDCRKNIIGPQLRRIRKSRRVTQLDLAARMQILGTNLDQQAVSNIENNRRIVTDFELACFCKALRCTAQELLQDFFDMLDKEG